VHGPFLEALDLGAGLRREIAKLRMDDRERAGLGTCAPAAPFGRPPPRRRLLPKHELTMLHGRAVQLLRVVCSQGVPATSHMRFIHGTGKLRCRARPYERAHALTTCKLAATRIGACRRRRQESPATRQHARTVDNHRLSRLHAWGAIQKPPKPAVIHTIRREQSSLPEHRGPEQVTQRELFEPVARNRSRMASKGVQVEGAIEELLRGMVRRTMVWRTITGCRRALASVHALAY
jgi:hypothetical protein